jgi:hypothetical protein
MKKPIIEELDRGRFQGIKVKAGTFLHKLAMNTLLFMFLLGLSMLLFNLAAKGPIGSW